MLDATNPHGAAPLTESLNTHPFIETGGAEITNCSCSCTTEYTTIGNSYLYSGLPLLVLYCQLCAGVVPAATTVKLVNLYQRQTTALTVVL